MKESEIPLTSELHSVRGIFLIVKLLEKSLIRYKNRVKMEIRAQISKSEHKSLKTEHKFRNPITNHPKPSIKIKYRAYISSPINSSRLIYFQRFDQHSLLVLCSFSRILLDKGHFYWKSYLIVDCEHHEKLVYLQNNLLRN